MKFNLLKCKITFVFSILLTGVMAQQSRFIYIQAENQKPFYVKLDRKQMNSSATGYIIIPGLNNIDYKLSFGFPKSDYPEQEVLISMKQAGEGFMLKENDNKTWSLVNIQTSQQLKSKSASENNSPTKVEKSANEFARILAEVVNDPSIALEKTRVQSEKINPVKLDTGSTETVKLVSKKKETTTTIVKDIIDSTNSVVKLKTDSTQEGLQFIYLDKIKKETDTIDVLVAFMKPVAKTVTAKKSPDPAPVKEKSTTKTGDARFIDMELQNPNLKKDSASATKDFVITEKKQNQSMFPDSDSGKVNTKQSVKKGMINTDCKKVASETEFLKLRKLMAAAEDESVMTKIALKEFTIYCFTAEQIKNLGVLFLKEEERYKFFVAAYPYVADTHNFLALEDQLTDAYYISRFKAMVSRN